MRMKKDKKHQGGKEGGHKKKVNVRIIWALL
jgi:hypothetical protein